MRLCLAVTFWGQEFRRYFLDFCLASLLAPGNIPAISDKSSSRLLIATNHGDWHALQTEPTFIAAKKFIQIEHAPCKTRAYSNVHEKRLAMSEAHKLLARKMLEERAHGIFLYPDMIVATGFICKLEELRRRGFKVVMLMNVRFANGGLLDELRQSHLILPGRPLALSSNDLVKLTLRHMHSEMQQSGFDNDYDDYGCTSYFWAVTSENLLFHCGNWVPSLIDYSSIDAHDDSTLNTATLDADYIAKNLRTSDGVYFVRDSDELCMISFTPESTVDGSLVRPLAYRLPLLRASLKVTRARDYLYLQRTLDWLRRKQFPLPIRFRGGYVPESRWREVERHAATIIARMERGSTAAERLAYACYCIPIWRHRRTIIWRHRRAIVRRLAQMLRGDRLAWRRAQWRVRQMACRLRGRPYLEPEPPRPPSD